MVQEEILEGSLLYHPVHGLCRVARLVKQEGAGEEVLSYSLTPKKMNSMKSRITFAAADLETSGFHPPVSLKEANEILEYLKTGDLTEAPASSHHETWDLAQAIFSYEKTDVKHRIKRQGLEHSITGLNGELAFVFNTTLKKSAEKIQKCLGDKLKADSLVLDLLSQV